MMRPGNRYARERGIGRTLGELVDSKMAPRCHLPPLQTSARALPRQLHRPLAQAGWPSSKACQKDDPPSLNCPDHGSQLHSGGALRPSQLGMRRGMARFI
jgi:hypothetical protein